VRRISQDDVRLLANLVPQVRPGELLEAVAGKTGWPHNVFSLYWPRANARSFAPNDVEPSSAIDVERVIHESAA
jgi:hypothetical protein